MKKEFIKKYICGGMILFGVIALSILFLFLLFRGAVLKMALEKLWNIILPFVYGAVMAYLLKPICNFFEKWFSTLIVRKLKWKKGRKIIESLSITCSLIAGLIVITLLIMIIVPQLMKSLTGIINEIPKTINEILSRLDYHVGNKETIENQIEQFLNGIIVNLEQWADAGLLLNLQFVITGVSSGVISIIVVLKNIIIGIIIAAYLLAGRKKFAAQGEIVLYSILKEKWADFILEEVRLTDQMFSSFITGKLIDSAIIGVICFIWMWAFDMPFSVLISVIIGITNIIPFFGPFIGGIPSGILILFVDPLKCIWFLIFILVLQQFDGNILGPKILGNTTGLSSFWVLFSILFFGGLFGFVGMIIGVPTFAVIYDIIKKLVGKGLIHRKKENMLENYRKKFTSKE